MLCGLLTPDSGEGTLPRLRHRARGQVDQARSRLHDAALLVLGGPDDPREPGLHRAHVRHDATRAPQVDEALDALGLTARAKQLAGALSGGWKQRLALAACLLHDPQLLLLDEPTAGVDPKARRDFWEEMHALAARGITVLVSTHYMDEAERCHKLGYILNGKLLAQGTAQEVIASQALTTWAVDRRRPPGAGRAAARAARGRAGRGVRHGAARHRIGSRAAARRARAADGGAAATTWHEVEPGLEDVFIHLMRRRRRDARGDGSRAVNDWFSLVALARHRRQGIHPAASATG